MENIAGPPVEGENFYGRAAEVVALLRDLHHHDVLLLGPRRIGKTSVARATLAAAQAAGWRHFEINVARCAGEAAFVRKLSEAVTLAARSWLGKAYTRLKDRAAALAGWIEKLRVPGGPEVTLGSAPPEDWADVASDALRFLTDPSQRWLIYVDELPIMLHGMLRDDAAAGVARVRRFLDWFRNDVRALPECAQVRWLVTGSVGLDTLVQRHGMADTINTLKQRGLDPFARADAIEMLTRLGLSHGIAVGAPEAERIVDAIGWPQPYYLQRVFHTLRDRAAAGHAVTPDAIDAAVARLTHHDEDNDFRHWETRLEQQLGRGDADHAIALLTLAAETRAGARTPFLFDRIAARMSGASDDEHRRTFIDLRDILLRDQYWWPDESSGERRYRFHLEPLRAWWQRRHAL